MKMNNRFKFRVWDKLAERMIYPHNDNQQHFIIDLNGRFHNLQNGSGGDDYVIQQYTGLKDKNGKEIYEGDVVEIGDRKKEVIFNIGMFYIDENYGDIVTLSEVDNIIEVIGNIFKTPELLKTI
jgi:uncharacterized phage protein (TIGR01671 family)